ncbi:MAG TPA: nickel-responsive transcriptional regulator NikR [Planctomycetota bacterium]|jgi:CopG family nickel-responsive transcriptional regulator
MKRGQRQRSRSVDEPDLIRFGISIPADLLKKFDAHLVQTNNQNRSEAIRDLIRDRLVQDAWQEGKGEQVATVTIVYDTQNVELQRRLSELKRSLATRLLSVMQVRLSAHQELEVIAMRGPATQIRSEAESLLALKGLLHGKFVMTTPGA